MPYNVLVFEGSEIFQVITAEKEDGKVLNYVKSKQSGSNCPKCTELSSRIHSYYTRKIMDLPMAGSQTWLILNARKFYCLNVNCLQKVFVERFSEHIVTGKTVTKRVSEKLLKIASLMGGNGGARICQLMNIPTSSSTLIRLIYQQPLEQNTVPKVLGIPIYVRFCLNCDLIINQISVKSPSNPFENEAGRGHGAIRNKFSNMICL
jgi:transposase